MRAYIEAGARQLSRAANSSAVNAHHSTGAARSLRFTECCNLFHGEKARSSENDQIVVRAAYETSAWVATEAALLA